MIHRRSPKEIQRLQAAADLLVEAFHQIESEVKPGVATDEIDNIIEQSIIKSGGKPAFKGYRGFPKSSCISIDEVVVHGIPDGARLKNGQIVGIDIGVELNGYFSDAARSFSVGEISEEKERLLNVTEKALKKGIEQVVEGNRISDISKTIQDHVEKENFSVVRELVGHGIGSALHEEPEIPNFYDSRRGPQPKIQTGMVFAIEPMVNMGVYDVVTLPDGWTVITADKKPSAHFEHTVVLTENGSVILTLGR